MTSSAASTQPVSEGAGAIRVEGLTKTFRDPKRGTVNAVDHVSFSVQKGEVFGLLGPNGAGKTTALRLLCTLLKPTSGTAELAGYDIVRAPEKVRERVGFFSGEMGLYDRLTPREILTFFGKVNGMNRDHLELRIAELVKKFDMTEFADTLTARLSTGMKQKTAIARTMLHDPPILILDEPTVGLDVPTARTVEQSILEARNSGKCIVFSTHVMEEAEYLCDRIAVIHGGKIQVTGTMEELRAATGKQRLREIFLDLLGLE